MAKTAEKLTLEVAGRTVSITTPSKVYFPDAGYTNSAAGISAATATLPNGFYRYDKHHLVPFV